MATTGQPASWGRKTGWMHYDNNALLVCVWLELLRKPKNTNLSIGGKVSIGQHPFSPIGRAKFGSIISFVW